MIYINSGVDERPVNPLLWPWAGESHRRLGMKEWILTRPFSIFYMLTIWVVFAILGLGSTNNCTETWSLEFICGSAIWANKIFTEPLEFMLSWLTGILFTNGIDQIAFVSIGFLIFVQSYERRMGTKNTIILFFTSTAVVSSVVSMAINWGNAADPSSEVFIEGMTRNWVGGSVGMYAIMGALPHCSRKPMVVLVPLIIFEIWNGQTNIGILTHSAHMLALGLGFTMGYWLREQSPQGEDGEE